MIRPAELASHDELLWAVGAGTDVWDLFCACIVGDTDEVGRLLDRNPALVRAHYEYRTPLSFAVRDNQIAVARLLLERGADPIGFGDLREVARHRGFIEMDKVLESWNRGLGASPDGEPVAAAIRDIDLARMKELLDSTPALVHTGDLRSNQPIHWAVMTRQLDFVDDLLARAADINAQRQDGARPIHLTNGDYHYRGWRDVPAEITATPDDVYSYLVARGATVDLGMAAAKGDLDRVREILDADPDAVNRVSEYGSYYIGCGAPLKNAVISGNIDIVKLMLERGADPNLPEEGIAPHGHALYSAVSNGRYEIAELLLKAGAVPDAPVESSADAVSIAVMNGDLKMLKLLAAYGATWEIDMRPRTPVSYEEIAATGVNRSMRILAAYGDVETATQRLAVRPALADDAEALQHAASHGHEEFVRLMLTYQPDLSRRVSVSRPRSIAQLLFDHGMDPNHSNWLRISPLHRFAKDGDIESAALFIERGADLDARDLEFFSTPLAWAARSGQIGMVEFLVRKGAKPHLPDDEPWATPHAWAAANGHDDIVRLLAEYDANGKLPEHNLEYFEGLATDLIEAYRSGSEAPLKRVMALYHIERPLTWDRRPVSEIVKRLRQFLHSRLDASRTSESASDVLKREDAQRLVALSQGFESWERLEQSLSNQNH